MRLAEQGEALPNQGCVLLAPADRHLLVDAGRVQFSYAAERLIVNCGAARLTEGDWARAQRSTAVARENNSVARTP